MVRAWKSSSALAWGSFLTVGLYSCYNSAIGGFPKKSVFAVVKEGVEKPAVCTLVSNLWAKKKPPAFARGFALQLEAGLVDQLWGLFGFRPDLLCIG